MKHRVRTLEMFIWSAGLVLLLAYGGTQYWYERARQQSILAFDAARPVVSAEKPQRTSGRAETEDPSIDMSMWSAGRVEAYRKHANREALPDAVLHIPRLKLVVPVFGGTSELNLNRGAGRIEGTGQLGKQGNVGIAAHRDGFFRALKDVQPGDTLYLEQPTTTLTYRVIETLVVEPSDVSVLRDTGVPTVTLVTCYPFYFVGSAPRRFIVHAQIVLPSAGVEPSVNL